MSTRKILTTMSFAALFAGAAMAAEPTKTLESIENVESFDVARGDYVQVWGAYYREGGLPDGKLHKGPVVNVGSMSIDGTFEVKASDQNANRLFDVENVSGTGEIRFGRGVYISQESDFSNFDGTLTLFTAVNEQGNRKGAGAYFLSGTNNPSNIKAFNLEENTELSFTNGNYTLNGKIEGAGTISARTRENLNFEGDKILENAAPANVVVRGDISEFTGAYSASEGSSIRIESQLVDSVNFSGSTGGILELAGIDGAQKKNIAVYSTSNTTTSGSVFMYGNTPIIGQNSNDGGTLGANGGYIYFGGKNGYSTAEKVSHTFDTTTVTGNTAGNVVVGGKGTGASMEAGADIVVDGVKIDSLVAGGAEGASVNGDINVTVKSGTVASLSGGKGGIHTGNTNITVENGSVANIYGGDQHGGQIKGDISVNVKDGTVGTIYGANYVSTSEKASDFNGVNGNVKIDVSGGTVNHIRGGINSTNAGDAATAKSKMVLNGNVEVNVSGNAHIGAADGESILATGGSYGSVNGNTTINISDNAVVEGIVAGGASRTDDKGVKSTYINVKGGTLNGDIYGGGLKYSTVTENTNVNISGGTVNANVYGGGATETTIVNGNANVNITGGTVAGSVYGAGNSDLIKGNTNVKMTSGTIGDNSSVVKHVAIYGGGEKGTIIEGSTKVEVSGGSMLANYESGNGVYGAGTENTVKGNTEVIISGGSLNNYTNVQGSDRLSLYNRVAGAGVGGVVEGNSSITIRGGENIVNVMGAGVGATVKGNTNVTIDGASVGDVMGGNIFARSGKVWEKDYTGGEVLGTANVEIKNGATVGMVIGGNSSGVTVGSTNVTISDSTVKNNVVGGNSVISGPVKSSYIAGGTVVNVENSTINGDIRGGNNTSNSDLFNGDFSSFKVSSVDINVTGNSTVGNGLESIRGAGGSYASVEGAVNIDLSGNSIFNGTILAGSSGNGTSVGSTNIKISDNVVVNGNVYGGGKNGGVVNGNTNVTLSGNASIKGTLNGGGVNGSVVEGTKTLNIGTSDEAYSNASALKVADFDKINVQGNSVATVNGNMSNVVVRKENTKTETLTGALVNVDSTSTAKFEDSNFNDNSVSVYVENPVQNYAAIVEGGIVNVNNVSEFKNSNFKGNVIKSEAIVAVAGSNVKGGIINASANSTIKIEGSAFEQNTINAKSNSSYATVYGGILNVNDGATANLVTTKFIKNNVSTTDSYGPIYGGIIRSLGDTTITSVTMDGNTLNTSGNASNFYGALISVANGTTTVSDSNFNNTIMEATKDNPMISGAIYVGGEPNVASSAQVLNVSNSTFSGNKATSSYGVNGSALYVTGETATANISNSIFENNTAVAGSYKARGGAVANYNGVMTLTDVSFKGNSAESSTVDPAKGAQGGALYARNYNSGARTVLNDVSFNDNTAKNGMGGAVYVEGSEIEFNVSKNATISGNMASDSDGNMSDSRGGFIYMENYEGSKASSANFNISENVKMTIGDGSLNKDSIASSDNTAVINKSGAGSLVVNGSMADFKGSLIVSAGVMNANNGIGAKSVSIANGATLGVALGNGALENASVTNNGTLSLKRGTLANGAKFVLSNYSGEGAVKAYGGILNGNTFTAGKSESFESSPITVGTGANDVQSVKLSDKLSLDFDVSGLVEAALSVNEIKASTDLGGIKGDVLAAFDVDLSDNGNTYSVVFSAYVGAVEDASKLLAWHKSADGVWTKLDTLIDYADEIASITVDSLGSYAFSQVPEPATYAAIFGALALAFAAYRRRK